MFFVKEQEMIVNLTDMLIDELWNIMKTNISDNIIHKTKMCLLDYLGVTLAGAQMQREKADRLLSYSGTNSYDSLVIGFSRKTDILNSIFINGLSSHIADFDDGANSGIIHLGSPIISAILPVAEKERIAADRVILGIVVGYEAALRIAEVIQPYHKKLGYHATGTCGTIGAAIGLSTALSFEKAEIKNALSAAAISAGGLLKALEDGSDLKAFNVARASVIGYISSNMAKAGFLGPNDVLSGKTGFLELFTGREGVTHFEFGYSKPYAVEKVYFKPYAACRYCHPAIEAAIKIRPKIKFAYDNIKEVNVKTYVWAVAKHDHADIQGITSAKMSIPYSVAVALYSGKADIEEFEIDRIKNSDVLSLAKKVKVAADDELTSLFPQKSAAIVELVTNDGASFVERVDYPKGEPENPLSEEEIKDKFMALAMYGNKTKEEAEKIIECVWDLENRLGDLFDLL